MKSSTPYLIRAIICAIGVVLSVTNFILDIDWLQDLATLLGGVALGFIIDYWLTEKKDR